MPTRAMRPCTYPGCNVLVAKGRCAAHSARIERDSSVKKLYNNQQWQSIRRRQLTEHPWCADCLGDGRHVLATEVDHVEPHRGDAEKFFAGPFTSLCKSHHSHKTAMEVLNIYPHKKSLASKH